jgi:cytochrome b subunit of formate dehydrogenase/cytochrome c5
MTQPQLEPTAGNRLSGAQRFERLVLVVAFIGLVLTGLPQKYASESWAELAIRVMGGIESVRILHRLMAILLIAESLYHLLAVAYRRFVLEQRIDYLPGVRDLRALWDQFLDNLGMKAAAPSEGRYTRRIEYLALVVSIILLALTGLILWNPVAAAAFLSGGTIPVARRIHSDHALLLVLFIVMWRVFVVWLWRPTTPAASVEPAAEAPGAVIAGRRRRFLPLAGLVVLAAAAGLLWFVTLEQTAIDTVPRRQAAVFAPQALPQTGDPNIGAVLWGTLRCAFCHGEQANGGPKGEPALRRADLTFEAFYERVRRGSEKMPAFGTEELPDGYLIHLWAWLSQQ